MTPNRKQPPIRDSPYAKQPGKKKKTDIQLSGIRQLDAQFANLDIGDSDPPTDDQEHALGILAAATEVLLELDSDPDDFFDIIEKNYHQHQIQQQQQLDGSSSSSSSEDKEPADAHSQHTNKPAKKILFQKSQKSQLVERETLFFMNKLSEAKSLSCRLMWKLVVKTAASARSQLLQQMRATTVPRGHARKQERVSKNSRNCKLCTMRSSANREKTWALPRRKSWDGELLLDAGPAGSVSVKTAGHHLCILIPTS